ncbi:Serine/arginine repetitive matrix protein 1 [Coemansia sp. RSA 2599]|nr:Serine/arginine repetitive matrix protein 1 [Coemansia sp. RSA 2598]KAJ1827793.1 Serine/arginine repetitive matrix protein 1 [Coemansia sp. RSA 2599]
MAGGFFRGTNIEQDQRFGDANKRLFEQSSFSSLLKKQVDMSKVNVEAIKPWISSRIHELLGIEDEVLYEYVVNMLEESKSPDPKTMQVNLTGFFEAKTQDFMQSLWRVLLEAQKSPGGIPESFIQKKIEELKRQRDEQDALKANIVAAEKRAEASSAQSTRTTRSGRRSRWDAPSAPAASDPAAAGQGKHGDRSQEKRQSREKDQSREIRSRYSRSRSPRTHRRDTDRYGRRDRYAKSRSRSPPIHT